jgi:hypothetical protein
MSQQTNNSYPERERLSAAAVIVALAVGGATLSGYFLGEAPIDGQVGADIGADVSYPQCDTDPSVTKALPDDQKFAFVGLNNGTPETANPCFADQMNYAASTKGGTNLPPTNIYINSGNPGKDKSKNWPTNGEFQGQTCTGDDSEACAYTYGQGLVKDDLALFQTLYGSKHNASPQDSSWAIDVEVGNYWQCNDGLSALCGTENALPVPSGALSRNAAVLAGMSSALKAAHITAEIYTNPAQWSEIVDDVVAKQPAKYSTLADTPVWVSGATTVDQARSNCKQPAFGGLGPIEVSQFMDPNAKVQFDQDVAC